MSTFSDALSAGTEDRMAEVSIFTEAVRDIIRGIPRGKVASYGQVAAAAGFPGRARQVSWILSRDSRKYNLPWQRVVNASGKISLKGDNGDIQQALLKKEGVLFSSTGKISMKHFGCFN